MSDNHGNTPAAWTSVAVSMVGFVIASIALLLDPINLPTFWVGAVIAVGAFPLFFVLVKMGLHQER